jgi:hypothetical protein
MQRRLVRLAYELQAGGNFVERLGESFVELGVRLRRASHGAIHLELSGEPGGVADVIGRWFHVGRAAGPLEAGQ